MRFSQRQKILIINIFFVFIKVCGENFLITTFLLFALWEFLSDKRVTLNNSGALCRIKKISGRLRGKTLGFKAKVNVLCGKMLFLLWTKKGCSFYKTARCISNMLMFYQSKKKSLKKYGNFNYPCCFLWSCVCWSAVASAYFSLISKKVKEEIIFWQVL